MTSSYPQILRSSATSGGAAGINMLIGMVSVKFGAVLLGPAAFGQLRVFQALLGFAGSLANMGVQESAVRGIAKASADGDLDEVARLADASRRIAWTIGLLAWILTAALSRPISNLMFGTHDHAVAIAMLGLAIPLGLVTASRLAVHRGLRRIGDVARMNVISAAASAAVSVGLFAWLRESGIVPSIICSSVAAFLVPLFFRRRLPSLPTPSMPMSGTLRFGRSMAGLGFALLATSIASALVGIFIPSLVAREFGASAVGMYAAAWGVSGLFATFILDAMGADYFPRLCGASHDRALMSRLVNEQTAVGVLLALPGLVATVVYAPLAIDLFYSGDFRPAAELLPWYSLGFFGRVASWPLGFVILANGQARTYLVFQLCMHGLWIGLTQLGAAVSGLVGVAWAFCALQGVHIVLFLLIVGWGGGVRWEPRTARLVALSIAVFGGVLLARLLPGPWILVAGSCGVVVAGIISLRGLAARLGCDHRLVRGVAYLPGLKCLLPGD